jgi:hypothetical protein
MTWRSFLNCALNQILGADEREKAKGELMKTDIALSFLDDRREKIPSQPTVRNNRRSSSGCTHL